MADLSEAKVPCSTAITARSSDTVTAGGGVGVGLKIGPKLNVGGTELGEAVFPDYAKQLHAAVDAEISAKTQGMVKASW